MSIWHSIIVLFIGFFFWFVYKLLKDFFDRD